MPYIIVSKPERTYVGSMATASRSGPKAKGGKTGDMGRLVKAVLGLAVVALISLAGYAYLGDLSPEQATITQPVVLDAQ